MKNAPKYMFSLLIFVLCIIGFRGLSYSKCYTDTNCVAVSTVLCAYGCTYGGECTSPNTSGGCSAEMGTCTYGHLLIGPVAYICQDIGSTGVECDGTDELVPADEIRQYNFGCRFNVDTGWCGLDCNGFGGYEDCVGGGYTVMGHNCEGYICTSNCF